MTSQTDLASKLLSECLLKGMVMTAQACGNCSAPLMRTRSSKEVTCVLCEQDQPPVEAADQGPSEAVEPTTAEPEKESPAPPTAKDISGLLGQKMLQGWALLDTQCPSCPSVPLVRNKQKYSSCVNCDTTFVLESDYDPKLHNLSVETKPEDAADKIQSKIRDTPSKTKASVESSFDISTAPPRHKLMRRGSSFESASLLETLSESSRVLHLKLSHLNEKLAHASDPQQIVILSGGIKGCIDALASSLSLKGSLSSP